MVGSQNRKGPLAGGPSTSSRGNSEQAQHTPSPLFVKGANGKEYKRGRRPYELTCVLREAVGTDPRHWEDRGPRVQERTPEAHRAERARVEAEEAERAKKSNKTALLKLALSLAPGPVHAGSVAYGGAS